MRFHNTLTRTVEDFVPSDGTIVTLYSCGPTVYDYAHIGNLRKYLFDDTLRRALMSQGYEVKHVVNITDVGHLTSDADSGQDKLEKGAASSGQTVWEVAERFTIAFKADMAALNVLPPSVNPDRSQNKKQSDAYARATDFVAEQIQMIQLLKDRGFVYQTDEAMYFEVAKLPNYGALSGQALADKETGARDNVVTDGNKRSPHDFAVWFFIMGHFADHTMHWPSPWGEGFPGWHLECSAIIHATLGDPIDIHTGGVDHIGTHHPNEMAQTEGAYGHALSRFWLHSQFVVGNGVKMSKSTGNTAKLSDLMADGVSPLAYRLLCLQAHYRSELSFTPESLTAAQNTLLGLYGWADLRHQIGLSEVQLGPGHVQAFLARMRAHLADDLGTPKALAELYRFMLELSPGMRYDDEDFEELLGGLDALLGLDMKGRADSTDEVKALLAERQAAREVRDYAQSDTLRNKLRKRGYDVDDTPNGPRWRRITG